MIETTNESFSENQKNEFKVLFTSREPIPQLIAHLQNLEIATEWIPLENPPNSIEEGFTFPILKSSFDQGVEIQADLVVAVEPETGIFSLGVRKFVNSTFVLFNIHQLTLLLSKLLLENHAGMELHRSIFISDLPDKLFSQQNLTAKVYADLSSPLDKNPALLTIPDGTLIVTENQEILLKGQRNSMEYLLGRIILESKKVKDKQETLFDILIKVYQDYGYQREKLMSVSMEGPNQKQFFKKIIEKFRKKSPKSLGLADVVKLEDLHNGTVKNLLSGRIVPSGLPFAPAIQVFLNNQVRFLMYPKNGKVYFLFVSEGKVMSTEELGRINQQYDQRVLKLIAEINRLGE